jgi:hypothetical protein
MNALKSPYLKEEEPFWYPDDINFYTEAIQTKPYLPGTFLLIPWKLTKLTKKDNMNGNTKFLLAIISNAVDKNDICYLSKEEIVDRMGPCTKDDKYQHGKYKWNNINRSLLRLEKNNWVEFEYTHNNRKIIKITNKTKIFFHGLTKKDYLLIPPDIFLLKLTSQRKMFLSYRLGFPDARKTKIAENLGVSERRIRAHYHYSIWDGILKTSKEPVEHKSSEHPSTVRRTRYNSKYNYCHNYILLGITSEFNKLNSIRDPSGPGNSCKIKKTRNTLGKEENMTIGKKGSGDSYVSQHVLFDNYKKDKDKDPELEILREEFPRLLIRGVGTKSYRDSIKLIRGLEQSITKVYGIGIIKRIADNLAPHGITIGQVNKCFSKTHTREERWELYRNLQNLTDSNYIPYVKNIPSLDKTLWDDNPNGNGIKSWLIYVMLKPPKNKYQLTDEDRKDFDATLDLLYDNWDALNDDKTEQVLKQLQEYYIRVLRPKCATDKEMDKLCGKGLYHLIDKYARWIVLHYEWQDRNDADINPGWFRPSSKPFKRYIKEFRKDLEKIAL